MIGQDYFDLRSRLDSALLALREIATENSSGDDQATVIDGLIQGLKKPYFFVVAGESSEEKSTFLNALSGMDLSTAGLTPAPGKILLLKHGAKLNRVPLSQNLEEVCLPVDFLRDFNVLDTPGTNLIENEHLKITGRFLPAADSVIFVFSAMNPWAAPAWQFLEKINPQLPDNVMLVLLQADQREPEEIQSMLDYMKRLCGKRFGREFSVFPVSASRAYLARSSGLDRDRLLAESGFKSLELHLSKIINERESHRDILADSLITARQMLGSSQTGFEKNSELSIKRAGILSAIDSGLAESAQCTFDKITKVSETSAGNLQQSVQSILTAAASQFKTSVVLRSLFRNEQSIAGIEPSVPVERAIAVQECWSDAAAVLETDVCAKAEQLRSQLADGLNVQAGEELKPDAVFWAAQHGRFLAQASGIQQRALSGLKISQHLVPALASSRKIVLRQVIITVICIMVAIVLGVRGSWISAGCVAGGAILAFLILGRAHAKLRANTLAECASHLAATPLKMKNLLDQQLRDETENLYELFHKALQPVREAINEQERRRTMLQRQMENLGRTFAELKSELDSSSARTI